MRDARTARMTQALAAKSAAFARLASRGSIVNASSTMPSRQQLHPAATSHLPALDGLRGLALLLVFCHHIAYTYPPQYFLRHGTVLRVLRFVLLHGWVGVDIFFVLSGFLVTGILLRSRQAENYSSVFYARRVLRIAPVYYGVLVFVFLVPGSPWLHYAHVPWHTQLWWWLSGSNVVSALHPGYLALLSPFWSLAIEEHFYLLWPLAVRRLTDRRLMQLALGLVAGEVVLRMLPPVVALTLQSPEVIYRWTPLHFDGLLLGSLAAIAVSTDLLKQNAIAWLRLCATVAALAAAGMLHAGLRFHTTPILSLAAASAVAMLALQNGRGWLSRLLSNRLLRRVGRYSYFMYATQTLVLAFAIAHVIPHLHLRRGALMLLATYATPILLSFACGAISWAAVEGPINGFRRHFAYRFPHPPAANPIPMHSGEAATSTLAA